MHTTRQRAATHRAAADHFFYAAHVTARGEITPCSLRAENLCVSQPVTEPRIGFHQFQQAPLVFQARIHEPSLSHAAVFFFLFLFSVPFKPLLCLIGKVLEITPKHLVLCTCLGAKTVQGKRGKKKRCRGTVLGTGSGGDPTGTLTLPCLSLSLPLPLSSLPFLSCPLRNTHTHTHACMRQLRFHYSFSAKSK